MKLALEIEFLTGVCRAAVRPSAAEPDWPPQPDRVFSALVAAWAGRGESAVEQTSLEWLEQQPPPTVHASDYEARTAPEVFVPPNDARSSKAPKTYLRVLPERRPRQPRRFPVARPHDPLMWLVWDVDASTEVLGALDAIARDVTYIGHSASLVRCRFQSLDHGELDHPGKRSRDRLYPGRLAELREAYSEHSVRPVIPSATSNPAPVMARAGPAEPPMVLEVLGEAPDLRATPLVCRQLRRALMSGYRRTLGEERIPEAVSGHAADGSPSRDPHLAIAPMAFVGHEHADGRVFGFILIPPRSAPLLRSGGFRDAFMEVAKYDEGEERRVLTLDAARLPASIALSPVGVSPRRSLSSAPYCATARVWASVTPVVLDRHLKRRDDEEIRGLVAKACEHAGLPTPSLSRIRVGKHSAVRGAAPARPLAGEPPWTAWRVPESLVSRPLVHVAIDFEQEVAGPVLLGAGRFTGLGLCRPIWR